MSVYSRNYDTTEDFSVPKNYDGTAFGARKEDSAPSAEPSNEGAKEAFAPPQEGGFFSSLLGKIPFASSLSAFGLPAPLRMPEIHGEELLIIAVALFLLFSKNGDKECAIILLILLFV